jgi:hypothetical protein
MSNTKKENSPLDELILQTYEKTAGNVAATSRELKVSRSTIRRHLTKLGKGKKPLASGSVQGIKTESLKLPIKGEIKRYILTSAQNNTYVHDGVWKNILALANHYKAEILVGTYSYNQNSYGPLAVKRGKFKGYDRTLWYDQNLTPYISDTRKEIGRGLVWCGEMNILPTATDPLSGLESYSGRKSAIFPHAKLAMRSVSTMQNEGTKLNYTTGTVTKRNYIQKRAGLIAEHHHIYGGLLVEVNHEGNWWVRQLNADDDGVIQDLNIKAKNGEISTENTVEAVTWGDLHFTLLDERVFSQSMEMLDTLKPKFQFMHDVLEGVRINHHTANNPHQQFKAYLRGLDNFTKELIQTERNLEKYQRNGSKLLVVYSNHDAPWVFRWLREHDYRKDPQNAVLFLKAQTAVYQSLQESNDQFNPLEFLLQDLGLPKTIEFLKPDDSYTICNKKIECAMHGHLGPNGAKGTPSNLMTMGRKANTAHTHSTGIYNGLYVAGTSTRLKWDYHTGPSSWSNSHIVTYPNGKRAIITIYNGQWRA